jgi:hypothetical protein
MIELLELCGYGSRDIESELPRLERAFKILGIDGADIERGKKRLKTYYDMDLESIKKGVGLCVRSVMDLVLAREDGKKKIIYFFMASGMEIIGSALTSKSEDIYMANLNGPVQFIMGGVFDKMVPVLEASERRWLKAGKAYHCANVKSALGFLDLGLIPKPDMLVTSGRLCDTAPKSLDLIQELYDIPVCSYDACIDLEFSEYPNFKRLIEYASKSARHLAKRIGDVVGFEITDSMLMEVIEAREGIAESLGELKSIMETSDPVPISIAHDIIWNCIATLSVGKSDLKEPTEIFKMTVSDLKRKVEKGEGILEKGAPRVIALLPPHYSDPRWEHFPYENGISLISCETGFFPPYGQREPDLEDDWLNDPYALINITLQSSLNQSAKARSVIMTEACRRLKVDGVLGKYHVGCRINVGDALIVKEVITKELGIPVLLLEWEGFDPRVMDEEKYGKQLETFKDIMENNRRDGNK